MPNGCSVYDIIRLWTLDPQELIDEGRPVLLPLLGQANLQQPQEIIPQVYQAIRSVPDKEKQQLLLLELPALLQDEEIIQMIETMMEQDEWVWDTPYLRRLRRQLEEAHEEGRKEERESRRQDMLKLILWRYEPPATEYLQLQTILSSIMADTKLKDIFDAIMNMDDFKQFYQFVEEVAQPAHEMEAIVA